MREKARVRIRGYLYHVSRMIEFFLNVFTEFSEFSDKICHPVKGFEPLPPSHPLCERPACYHSASLTHVRDRNFKLSSIHAPVIISFPELAEFSESYAPFRKNSIVGAKFPQTDVWAPQPQEKNVLM